MTASSGSILLLASRVNTWAKPTKLDSQQSNMQLPCQTPTIRDKQKSTLLEIDGGKTLQLRLTQRLMTNMVMPLAIPIELMLGMLI